MRVTAPVCACADFSVLLPSIDNIANVAAVGQRIFDVMRQPLHALGNEIYLTPNIGVAGYPDDAPDTATLIKCALSASGQAVEQGVGRLQFYSAEMNEVSIRQYRLEADLHNAIENEEFRLFYQPKVNVRTGSIIGAEALIRWYQADGTAVSPADFIPVAEETGLILPIGEWVSARGLSSDRTLARRRIQIEGRGQYFRTSTVRNRSGRIGAIGGLRS